MVSMEIYDWIRMILIIFILSLVVISIILIVQGNRNNIVNGFTISMISIISVAVSAICLIITGYIADELNLAGDALSFNLFLAIAGLNIINIFIFLKK